jgi:prephenate dehydratase
MHTFAYLGPAGTFTEAALKKISCDSDKRVPYINVTAALDAVRSGEADYAVVPIENSVEGVVARTLDELATGVPLTIAGEITHAVTFDLMARDANTPINRIGTHPHAESQCRAYLSKHYPHAEIVPTNSTAAAAELVAKGSLDAAIASSMAAENFGLQILAANIGDNQAAVTRFIAAQKPGFIPEATGHDRTSLVVYIDIDHAGALLEILSVFAKYDVNLTFIQSRPTGRELGHYHFLIDVEGHINDKAIAASMDELREICDDIRFLGSYPREVRA